MSTVQRLFNDFSQISVEGVAEIIAVGLAAEEGRGSNNDKKKKSIPRMGRATLELKW